MSGTTTSQTASSRRVRHDVRDAMLTMAFTITASTAVAALVVAASLIARMAN